MNQVSSSNPSYPLNIQAVGIKNIDMFMACCDWEKAINDDRELIQGEDHFDDESPLLASHNNIANEDDKSKEAITNSQQH